MIQRVYRLFLDKTSSGLLDDSSSGCENLSEIINARRVGRRISGTEHKRSRRRRVLLTWNVVGVPRRREGQICRRWRTEGKRRRIGGSWRRGGAKSEWARCRRWLLSLLSECEASRWRWWVGCPECEWRRLWCLSICRWRI